MKFKQSEVIVECEPFAHCVAGGEEKKRCHYCLEEGNFLKSCSGCKVARYCSKQCQAKDWQNVHQMECKIFKKDSLRRPPSLFSLGVMRLVLRVILILKKHPEKEFEMVDTYGGPRNFQSLMRCDEIVLQKKKENIEPFINHLSKLLCLQPEDLKNSPEVSGKIILNAFTIRSNKMKDIGHGLYIAGSVFDHSCSPNSTEIFDGIRMQVIALKEFDAEFEPPLISYVNPRYSKKHRQKSLEMKYFFTCCCSRCSSGDRTSDPNLGQLQNFELLMEQGKLVEAFDLFLKRYELSLEILPILYPPLLDDFQCLRFFYAMLKSENYSIDSYTARIEKYSSMILSTHSPLLEKFKIYDKLSVYDSYGNVHADPVNQSQDLRRIIQRFLSD